MNRRGFLGLLSGAIAVAATGITPAPPRISQPGDVLATTTALTPRSPTTYVHARHLYAVDLGHMSGDGPVFWHRIDVIYDGQQIGIDLRTMSHQLQTHELEPALSALDAYLDQHGVGCRVGELYTFSMDEWNENREAREMWKKLGEPNAGRLS